MTDSVAPADITLGVAAYEYLSERSQTVLWHLVLERESSSEVAVILGCPATEVATLASAARAELRTSLVDVYSESAEVDGCGHVLHRLSDYHDGRLPSSEMREIDEHLATCAHCRAALRWMSDIPSVMEAAVLPSVLGAEAAARYLDQRGSDADVADVLDEPWRQDS